MKNFIRLATAFTLLAAGTASAWAQAPQPEQVPYRGDLQSFKGFNSAYALNWPEPEKIDYFDPSGGTEKTIRYAHWVPAQSARAGVVVHFNGRTEFIERNIYTYKDLLDRGFEVWALDWRGQGLSSRQVSGKQKQKHTIDTFDTYVADAMYFINEKTNVKQTSGKKILLAHSMGGQIALRYLLREGNDKVFDYAVLSSPLLRLTVDTWYVRPANWLKVSLGGSNSCGGLESADWLSDFKPDTCAAIKKNELPILEKPETAKTYSNDVKKLAETTCLVEKSLDASDENARDLRVACATSGWLRAALVSTDVVMTQAERLKTPTLMVYAYRDHAVDNDGQAEFCAKVKPMITCERIEKVNGIQTGHELLIEEQPIRDKFFLAFDQFVGVTK